MPFSAESRHPEYARYLSSWQRIDHVTRGVDQELQRYIPDLNPVDTSPENKARNQAYKARAVFYRLTAQTVSGMLGTVYRKDPMVELPTVLEYFKKNADGAGNNLYQSAQGCTDDVIRKGRAGVAVTFPAVEGLLTKADMVEGRYAATIHRFSPEQIINWRTDQVGSKSVLTLVVTEQFVEDVASDGYTIEMRRLLREMRLVDGVYQDIEHRETATGWVSSEPRIPTDSNGNTWDEIPFIFVGSENNDPAVDFPTLLAMADINLGHYRNSADWEESTFMTNQPQAVMVGVTESWLDTMRKHGNVHTGARVALPLPEGADFKYVQPSETTSALVAMRDKVEQMVGLGARMVSPGSAARTATQVEGERESQHSQLSLIAANVSEAYTRALQWAARFMGADEDKVSFALNQDFIAPDESPQKIQAIITGFMQGAIPAGDFSRYMQRIGIFDAEKAVEDYQEELPTVGGLPDFGAGGG